MIDEKTTDLIIERLVRRTDKANEYFLKEMGKTISKIRELNPTQAQQLVQMLKYGDNYDRIVKEIAKNTDLNVKEINDIFEAYAEKDQLFYKQFYQYRNKPFIPYKENRILKAQTDALKAVARAEMYNFTRSNVIGYTMHEILPNGKKGRIIFRGLRDTYNQLLDMALLNVGQGKDTFDSAMAQIMEDIGGSGLKTINYESGRSIRLDSAISMHLQGKLLELHNENQKITGEEIDYDGWEISVHGNPAPDHAKAQGRQFSIEQYEILQSGEEATDYKGVKVNLDHDGKNGYRPISEMNCYHYAFTIILGVNKPQYSDEKLKEIERKSKEKITFNGRKYTIYEGTQLQRRIEREVRQQKDIQIFAKEANNQPLVTKANKKIRQLMKRYKELCDVSGLPPQMERMKVAGYKRGNG